jgi:hypothetical protein
MSYLKIKGGTAVYICMVPPSFRPQRPWDTPDEILSARLHSKNLKLIIALNFARAYNMPQVQSLQDDHRIIESWAIVVRHLKPEWRKHPLRAIWQIGGAK